MIIVTILQVEGKKWGDCSVAQRQVTDYFTQDNFGAKEVGFASVRSKRLKHALLQEENGATKQQQKKANKSGKALTSGDESKAYGNFYEKHSREIEVRCRVTCDRRVF